MSTAILQPSALTDRTNTNLSTVELMQHVRDFYPSPPPVTKQDARSRYVATRRPETLRRNITPLKDVSNNHNHDHDHNQQKQNNLHGKKKAPTKKKRVAKRARLQELSQPRASGTRQKFIAWSPERAASLRNPTKKGRRIVPQRSTRLQRLAAPRGKRVKFTERRFQILEVSEHHNLLTKALDVQRKDAKDAAQLVASVSRTVSQIEQRERHHKQQPLTARALHAHENPQSPQSSPGKKPRPSSAPSTPKPYIDSKLSSNNRALNMEKQVTRMIRFREDIVTNIRLSIRDGTYVEKFDYYVDQLREATLKVTEGIASWRTLLFQKVHRNERAPPFIYRGSNYLLSIPSSLDFVGKNQEVVYTLGGTDSYSAWKRNPFLLRDCEYLDSYNSVARTWETRMRYFSCEKIILAEERTTYGGTNHLGHFVSFSSCLAAHGKSKENKNKAQFLSFVDSDGGDNRDSGDSGDNRDGGDDSDGDIYSIASSCSSPTTSPRYSPLSRTVQQHTRMAQENMTLEEQAHEIHARLQMSFPAPIREERKIVTTPRVTRRPNSAPSPHQKLLQRRANEMSMSIMSSSLVHGGTSSSSSIRTRPHTTTGARPSSLSLARFHASLSEAMDHIGRIGHEKTKLIDSNVGVQNSSASMNGWTLPATSPKPNFSRSSKSNTSSKRSIISSISTHRNVASTISRSRQGAASAIQLQWRQTRKRRMIQNALSQMNRIVRNHLEEAACGCLQRVWRGSNCRRVLLREWAPTLVTSPTAQHAITLRRKRKKARGHPLFLASSSSSSSSFSTPWRSQPRFAIWRIQWWLSRALPRWRFQRQRRAARKLQQQFRQYKRRRNFLILRCAIKIQTHWRCSKAREERKVRQMKAFHMSALFIQTAWWKNLKSKRRREEMRETIRVSMALVERRRYETAMEAEDFLSLVDRDNVLENLRDHGTIEFFVSYINVLEMIFSSSLNFFFVI